MIAEAGGLRVPHTHGHEEGREHDAGEQIDRRPRRLIVAQGGEPREPRACAGADRICTRERYRPPYGPRMPPAPAGRLPRLTVVGTRVPRASRRGNNAVDWSFGDVLLSMLVFFFWIMAIWVFIAIFADIFRRNDLSGWAKAGWILLLFVLPFLGALIYVIARPKMTEQDREIMAKQQEQQRRVEGYSASRR